MITLYESVDCAGKNNRTAPPLLLIYIKKPSPTGEGSSWDNLIELKNPETILV